MSAMAAPAVERRSREIRIRDATIDEASKWDAIPEDAVNDREQAAGGNSWLVFLVLLRLALRRALYSHGH